MSLWAENEAQKLSEIVSKLYNTDFLAILEYFGLRKHRRSQDRVFILCPFHKEEVPSFLVGGRGNFGYCFSCGRSWTPVQFVKDKLKCRYAQALKILAEINKVELSEKDLQTIINNYKVLWKRFESDPVQEVYKKKQELKKLKLLFEEKFIHLYRSIRSCKYFYHYIDFFWEEFDLLASGGREMTPELIDQIKDWYFKVSKFVESHRKDWESFEKFKFESFKEIVDI